MRHLLIKSLSMAIVLAAPVSAQNMNLVQTLVKQTGVTEKQASGGAGLMLDFAKQNLSTAEFASLTKSVPEFGPLAAEGARLAPPKPSGAAGALSGVAGAAKGVTGLGGGLSSLGGGFKALGLSPDMVSKFAPILLDYAKTKGGAGAFNLLSKVLK